MIRLLNQPRNGKTKGDKIFEECTTTAAFEELLADDAISSDIAAIMRWRYQAAKWPGFTS